MVRQDHTRSSLKSTITSFSFFNRPIFYNIQFFTLLLTWRIVCTMLQLHTVWSFPWHLSRRCQFFSIILRHSFNTCKKMIVDIQSIIYINMICLGIRIFNAYIKKISLLYYNTRCQCNYSNKTTQLNYLYKVNILT